MRLKARSICFVLGVCISVSMATATSATAKSPYPDDTPNVVLDCALGFDALAKMIEQLPQSLNENGIRTYSVEDPERHFLIVSDNHPTAPMILLSVFVTIDDVTYMRQSHCSFGDQQATDIVIGWTAGTQLKGGPAFIIYPPMGKDFQAR